MKILITGGAGFIGSHIAEAYLAAGHTVAILDNFSTGKRSNLAEGATVFEADITDALALQKVVTDVMPDIISHHAAQVSVITSIKSPAEDARLNVIGTINLLEAARLVPRLRKVIYPSSGGTIYGRAKHLPFTEETPAEPIAHYALSKYTGEEYLRLYSRLYGINSTVLRYSNVYGPRQDPHGEAGVCAIFCNKMLRKEPTSIFGDGSQTRDYIYIDDIVAANVLALEKGDGEVFNIATGVPVSTQQVFDTIHAATQSEIAAVYAPERPGELQEMYLSNDKAQQLLGWQPQITSFQAGIEKTVDWYRHQG